MPALQILFIEDHAMFRTGLGLVLKAAWPRAELMEVDSLDRALDMPFERPDVVLLDLQLPGLNGLHGIEPLKHRWPGVPVLVVSAQTDALTARQALERGACGFVSKAERADHVVRAIRAVLPGLTPDPQGEAEAGMAQAAARALTPRQSEVLALLHKGMPNKAIARLLCLSDNTVRRHVQDILAFFSVDSRAEAVYQARKQGIVD